MRIRREKEIRQEGKYIILSAFPWGREYSPLLFKVRLTCKLLTRNPKYWKVAEGPLRKDKDTEDLLGFN